MQLHRLNRYPNQIHFNSSNTYVLHAWRSAYSVSGGSVRITFTPFRTANPFMNYDWTWTQWKFRAHTHTPTPTNCVYFRLNKLWMHERMHVGNEQPVNLVYSYNTNFAFDLCSSTVFLNTHTHTHSISYTVSSSIQICCDAIRSCGNLSPLHFSHRIAGVRANMRCDEFSHRAEWS